MSSHDVPHDALGDWLRTLDELAPGLFAMFFQLSQLAQDRRLDPLRIDESVREAFEKSRGQPPAVSAPALLQIIETLLVEARQELARLESIRTEQTYFVAAEILFRISPKLGNAWRKFADYLAAGFAAGLVAMAANSDEVAKFVHPKALAVAVVGLGVAVVALVFVHLCAIRATALRDVVRVIRRQDKKDRKAGRDVDGGNLGDTMNRALIWPYRRLLDANPSTGTPAERYFHEASKGWRSVQREGIAVLGVALSMLITLAVLATLAFMGAPQRPDPTAPFDQSYLYEKLGMLRNEFESHGISVTVSSDYELHDVLSIRAAGTSELPTPINVKGKPQVIEDHLSTEEVDLLVAEARRRILEHLARRQSP